MTQHADLDPEAIAGWMRRNVAGFAGPLTLTKFAQGQSNPTYRIDSPTGPYVLRAKPPGKLLASAHLVEREFRAMQALAGSGVPVPGVFALADDAGSPIGRAFFVMEYLDGRVLFDPALPGVAPAERAGIYDAMGAALAALHSVDPQAVGLGDFGKPGNYFARQTDRWTRQYLAAAPEPGRDMTRLARWLADEMPGDDGRVALVHGDYRLDNMVFAHDGPRILGLLDWELATLGHPLADLAYQCMQWRLPHDGDMRGLGGLDRAGLGIPSEARYVADYAARTGLVVENWTFSLVFAFFRLAAILEGVARRAQDGNASNPAAGRGYARMVPVLAGMAVALTETGA